MSFDALSWAAKHKPGSLGLKMVLLALANWANEDDYAYPSVAALSEFGDMDPKTVTAALDKLEKLGLIEDTGKRAGRTKQIKVYRLCLERKPETEGFQNRKAPENLRKAPQKRVTDTGSDTDLPTATPSEDIGADGFPVWLPREQWASFLRMRKKIRAPLTDDGVKLAIAKLRKLRDAGNDPAAVLERSILHDWRGLFEVPADERPAAPAANNDLRFEKPGEGPSLATFRRKAADAVTEGTYRSWLDMATMRYADDCLTIAALSEFACAHIANNLGGKLTGPARAVFGQGVKVAFLAQRMRSPDAGKAAA